MPATYRVILRIHKPYFILYKCMELNELFSRHAISEK